MGGWVDGSQGYFRNRDLRGGFVFAELLRFELWVVVLLLLGIRKKEKEVGRRMFWGWGLGVRFMGVIVRTYVRRGREKGAELVDLELKVCFACLMGIVFLSKLNVVWTSLEYDSGNFLPKQCTPENPLNQRPEKVIK